MQKRNLSLILIIVGIAVLAAGLYSYTLTTTQTETSTLAASEHLSTQYSFGQGDIVHGSLTINGTEGIKFYVKTAEDIVYNGGTIYTNLDFTFNAPAIGTYSINIENLSPTNQQSIEYSITYPTLPSMISLSITLVGIVCLLISVVVLLFKKKPA